MSVGPIRIRDQSELQLDRGSHDFTGMTATALTDFQPLIDANEQDENGLVQTAGDGEILITAAEGEVGNVADANGNLPKGSLDQEYQDLTGSAPGRTSMLNSAGSLDLSGPTFVQHLQAPIIVPKHYQSPPPNDNVIARASGKKEQYKFWPKNKPTPMGWIVVSAAELQAGALSGAAETPEDTQAGG